MMKKAILLVGVLWAISTTTSVYGQGWDPARPFLRSNEKFKAAFKEVIADARKSTVRVRCDGKSTALGMVIGPSGWILTKLDDLKGDITCLLPDGREIEAEIVGAHKRHDLALLKIEASDLTPIGFADSATAMPGNWVATVGQSELPLVFGVVGVAKRTIPNGGGPIKPKTNFGYLGVRVRADSKGLVIDLVEPRKPAQRAGLKKDDILLSINGKKITMPQHLVTNLMNFKPGEKVTLSVKRGDREFKVEPTLTNRPISRGEKQNRMGSRLSNRRMGYPVVLQHDAVVKPEDCGGPLVDLDGRVVAMNISRVGRTETHAIPAEVIKPILVDLMSGKLAPEGSKNPKDKASLRNQLDQAQRKIAELQKVIEGLRKQLKDAEVDTPKKAPAPKLPPNGTRPPNSGKQKGPDPSRINPPPTPFPPVPVFGDRRIVLH